MRDTFFANRIRITRITMRDVIITQTEGRSSQYHKFYSPDGIREIAFATFGSYAISKPLLVW